MKKTLFLLLLLPWLAGCSPGAISTPGIGAVATEQAAAAASPTNGIQPTKSPKQSATVPGTPQPNAKSGQPVLDPLTGLPVKDTALLERRPILIKVENLPRDNRPQWGLSFADLVYEYYTEEGTTRFAALFYSQDSEKVAPIRSARFFDIQLMRMYKPFFVFGSAYKDLLVTLGDEFGKWLLLEQPNSCPAICRYDPNGRNILMANTVALQDYVEKLGMDNSHQSLEGMAFDSAVPAGGDKVDNLYIRYSGAIYNRWEYNAKTGRYLRFSDAKDDINRDNPVYEALLDRVTGKQIATDNVVVVLAEYIPLVHTDQAEVNDIKLNGKGPALIARDGHLFEVQWQRKNPGDVLALIDQQGKPFPFKPGQTWFEVIGKSSVVNVDERGWQFVFLMP